jgi:hypothetical protein
MVSKYFTGSGEPAMRPLPVYSIGLTLMRLLYYQYSIYTQYLSSGEE